eukprot:TRINITY_DN5476_c0_g1_i8.p1 TRINITY_DN5476_c0_g1~~TRINITY_DN5476_c0_g1_i8.p1  ORF type:complete len:379 (+),score=102.54 TRINITY_DN5476_c0_g1_i8:106-1137(+)
MWLAPFVCPSPEPRQWLAVSLPHTTSISGLRLWNYNKSPDDTSRGLKIADVFVDDVRVSPPSGFIFRKAPGNVDFDFGQTVMFDLEWANQKEDEQWNVKDYRARVSDWNKKQRQLSPSYILPLLPIGHVFKFVLLSTWGDVSYVGLNGIQLFDPSGQLIPVSPHNVAAKPESVAVLSGMEDDVRRLENLFDGVNHTWDPQHMWLTPFTPSQPCVVYVYFDYPVAISLIKIWNYSRTRTRGVHHLQIFLDDILIWEGVIRQAPPPPHPDHPSTGQEKFGQSIIFAADEELMYREKEFTYDQGPVEQEVVFFDQRRLVQQSKTKQQPTPDYNLARPHTSVTRSHH